MHSLITLALSIIVFQKAIGKCLIKNGDLCDVMQCTDKSGRFYVSRSHAEDGSTCFFRCANETFTTWKTCSDGTWSLSHSKGYHSQIRHSNGQLVRTKRGWFGSLFRGITCIGTLGLVCGHQHLVTTPIPSKWDHCGCRWLSWQSWSDCTRSCLGGTQRRERHVWKYNWPECKGFEACATDDMGFDQRTCNNFCYNGGTVRSGYCRCPDGWRGTCCGEKIACGDPGMLPNGRRRGYMFDYGNTVIYICEDRYNMTQGTSVRTCNKFGRWTGSMPRCIFVQTCLSNPCQNGGTCVDGLDRYSCLCANGLSGINCERDIQPPVMTDCPSNMKLFVSKHTISVNWTIPTFTDPMGTTLKETHNYPSNHWEFPWGDYTVQYSAVKPSNGLRTECVFNITVRPHPCPSLNIPPNGARVCNGWKRDFGQYCMVFCDIGHDVYSGIDINQWYVCGASGVWKPGGQLPDCGVTLSLSSPGDGVTHFRSCNNTSDVRALQGEFIERLNKLSLFLLLSRLPR